MAGANFVGKAGQLAVMAEFLLRGYNVAMPEVDVGDDVFVVNDRAERLWRIQVKTAVGMQRRYGWSGRFLVPLEQLLTDTATPLHYVLVLRRENTWEFVPIARERLDSERRHHGVGSRAGDSLLLYLAYRQTGLVCSQRDWQNYRNNWDEWPLIPQ
jgi:hypothetical protein